MGLTGRHICGVYRKGKLIHENDEIDILGKYGLEPFEGQEISIMIDVYEAKR
jgi:hypothetical protein